MVTKTQPINHGLYMCVCVCVRSERNKVSMPEGVKIYLVCNCIEIDKMNSQFEGTSLKLQDLVSAQRFFFPFAFRLINHGQNPNKAKS